MDVGRKVQDDFPQMLLNSVLREKIGRSQQAYLLAELTAKVPARLPEGMTMSDVIEVFSLAHWFKHYKRTREFWLKLDGEVQRVTCLEIRPADRCMVVLDKNKTRREVVLDSPEAISNVEDDDQRRLRKLLTAVERLDARVEVLHERQENIQQQLDVTAFKLMRVEKSRDRLRAGAEELQRLFDEKRNAYRRAIGPLKGGNNEES